MNDEERRLERALAGRPRDADERGWAEGWQALREALPRPETVDAAGLAAAVLRRQERRRMRFGAFAAASVVVVAAAFAALRVQPAAPKPAREFAAAAPWRDGLDDDFVRAHALVAAVERRPAPPLTRAEWVAERLLALALDIRMPPPLH